MNLLTAPWLPVRLKSGRRAWIAPDRLGDAEIVAFDADRADFNGALMQFSIGLLQSVAPVENGTQWKKLLNEPPSAATLAEWFAPYLPVFEFDGEGARFMQDLDLQAEGASENTIGALFIEMPGENALRNNSDHFIKRGGVSGLCPDCAATALLTLQINAPAGGAGYRTGLRGGGPLTTLLLCEPAQSLWQDLWLNVQERPSFLSHCGDANLTETVFRFPWMGSMEKIQPANGNGETQPARVHPDHIFWAMPRRIRLDFEQVAQGQCDVCGRESAQLVQRFITRNYGLNYKGPWDHPLSPYYQNKEDWLPLHPQPGGLGYRHWLAWVLGHGNDKKNLRAARVVEHAMEHRTRQIKKGLHLWAFGYDMKKANARCWYESKLPLYNLAERDADAQRYLKAELGTCLNGADLAAQYTRNAVKDAWFSADAKGDFSVVDAAFLAKTETAFYRLLQDMIAAFSEGEPYDDQAARAAWHKVLTDSAEKLFDQDFVGTGLVERQNPRRVALAYNQLRKNLRGPKLLQTLLLPIPEKTKAPKKAKGAK